MKIQKCRKLVGLLFVLGACTGLVLYIIGSHPTARFDRAVSSIASNPQRWIDEQIDFSTSPLDQPIFGHQITSEDVNAHVMSAYTILKYRLKPSPTTYFFRICDFPVQETIWQYPNYIVRLYVTSGIDCDGAAVGVFQGTYEEFRKDQLSDSTDIHERISQIPFEAPVRFLQNR
jgi:hypothetical protein